MMTRSEHLETSNGAPYLLVAENLRKTYDNKVALKSLSFSARTGPIVSPLDGRPWFAVPPPYCADTVLRVFERSWQFTWRV